MTYVNRYGLFRSSGLHPVKILCKIIAKVTGVPLNESVVEFEQAYFNEILSIDQMVTLHMEPEKLALLLTVIKLYPTVRGFSSLASPCDDYLDFFQCKSHSIIRDSL